MPAPASAVAALATLFGSGSFLGLGQQASVCVDVPQLLNAAGVPRGLVVRGGVDTKTTGFRLCASSPTAAQRMWFSLLGLQSTVLLIGALWLVRRVVVEARTLMYSTRTARRLRQLGWFLAGGAGVHLVTDQLLTAGLLRTFLTAGGPTWPGNPYHLDMGVLLAGVGVLSFARIVRVGVQMRDDLEGTV